MNVRVPHERTLPEIEDCLYCQPVSRGEWVLCRKHRDADEAHRRAAAREGLPW